MLLSLIGCSSTERLILSPQDASTMTIASSNAKAYSPRLDAEQALSRLVELIRGTRAIGEISAENLHAAFGVPFNENGGRFGFAEQLSADWWSSLEWDPTRSLGPQFSLTFVPVDPDRHAPATAICGLDFQRFATELQHAGFERETYRTEHSRVIHDRFQRDGLSVTVYIRGESDASPEKIAHACIEMIHVQ